MKVMVGGGGRGVAEDADICVRVDGREVHCAGEPAPGRAGRYVCCHVRLPCKARLARPARAGTGLPPPLPHPPGSILTRLLRLPMPLTILYCLRKSLKSNLAARRGVGEGWGWWGQQAGGARCGRTRGSLRPSLHAAIIACGLPQLTGLRAARPAAGVAVICTTRLLRCFPGSFPSQLLPCPSCALRPTWPGNPSIQTLRVHSPTPHPHVPPGRPTHRSSCAWPALPPRRHSPPPQPSPPA